MTHGGNRTANYFHRATAKLGKLGSPSLSQKVKAKGVQLIKTSFLHAFPLVWPPSDACFFPAVAPMRRLAHGDAFIVIFVVIIIVPGDVIVVIGIGIAIVIVIVIEVFVVVVILAVIVVNFNA